MDVFAQGLLSLMLAAIPPDKPSPHSFEVLTKCGDNPDKATCVLAPQCADNHHFACAKPRWSAARNGWVIVETREHRIRRYAEIATAATRAARWMTRCVGDTGVVDESCHPIRWPEGPLTLALSAVTAATWESGFREDIQNGYAPLGRGSGGEVCLMQIMPEQAIPNAVWLSPADRQRLLSQLSWKERRAWANQLLGDSKEALFKCFVVGMNMLARARRHCARKGDWVFGMYSLYGTGRTCAAHGIMDRFAAKRVRTYRKMRSGWRPKKQMLPPAIAKMLGIAAPKRQKVALDPRIQERRLFDRRK